MTKALFIRPPHRKIIEGETPLFETKSLGYLPPLGMMSVATYVNEMTDHRASVLDAGILGLDGPSLSRAIRRERPDVIGLSPVSFTLLDTLDTAGMIKEIDSEIMVVMGGSHPIEFPQQTAGYENVDAVVTGEGEIVFSQLLDSIARGKTRAKKARVIPGTVQKIEGKIVTAPNSDPISDLDRLPIPDRTLTPYEKYTTILSQRNPATIMSTTRGCPYRCSFCYLPLRTQSAPYRARSAELMVKEMQEIAALGIKEVFIYDDTFTLDRERARTFATMLRDLELDLTWDIRTRADLLDSSTLTMMKAAGLRRVQMGIESGTQAGMSSIRKDLTPRQARDGISMINAAGLDSFGYFMLGLPGETREMIEETIRFAMTSGLDYATFSVFLPLPGTHAWKIAASEQPEIIDAWTDFVERPSRGFDPPTMNGILSKDELYKILEKAYRRFFFRPSFFFSELKKIRSMGEFLVKSRRACSIFGAMVGSRVKNAGS